MEKQYLEPIELLQIASQHAYCAEHLLQQNAEISFDDRLSIDALLPISSLIHTAFELTFKAFLLHEHRPVKHHKNLNELAELNSHLGLSKQDRELLSNLSRTRAFRKGIDYVLWENREQLHSFCEQCMRLYARLQKMVPVELHQDFVN